MRREYPPAGQVTPDLDTWPAQDHKSPRYAIKARFSPVDAQLAHLPVSRHVKDYARIAQMLAGTRRILTTGAHFVPLALWTVQCRGARPGGVRAGQRPPTPARAQCRTCLGAPGHARRG